MITLLINDTSRPSVLTTSYAFQDENDLGISVATSVSFMCFLGADF